MDNAACLYRCNSQIESTIKSSQFQRKRKWREMGTQNLKLRRNYLTKSDIEKIGGKLFLDEEFRRVEGESAIWISNYARLLSKRKGKPRILKTVFQKGYQRVTLPQSMYGKTVKHRYYLHVLVAKAFCRIPEWIKSDERIEVHHISSVDHEHDIDGINYACNLMYVPRKLHKAFDSITEICINLNGKWVKKDFVEAAEFYGISPYEFIEAIGNEKYKIPTKTRANYQYYQEVIDCEEKSVNLNVRLVRTRDNK